MGNTCPAEIYKVLREHSQRPHNGVDQRKHSRNPLVTLAVLVPASEDAFQVSALTLDVSQSGLAVVASQPVQPGSGLRCCFVELENEPSIYAYVLNCIALGTSLYRISLRFTAS